MERPKEALEAWSGYMLLSLEGKRWSERGRRKEGRGDAQEVVAQCARPEVTDGGVKSSRFLREDVGDDISVICGSVRDPEESISWPDLWGYAREDIPGRVN